MSSLEQHRVYKKKSPEEIKRGTDARKWDMLNWFKNNIRYAFGMPERDRAENPYVSNR